ncbi:unnamed protein product, partial [Didymodactylos carnosus]
MYCSFCPEDWRVNQFQWSCKGDNIASSNKVPKFRTHYLMSKDKSTKTLINSDCFKKKVYTLLENDKIVVVHYIGDQSKAIVAPFPATPRSVLHQIDKLVEKQEPAKVYRDMVVTGGEAVSTVLNKKQVINRRQLFFNKMKISHDEMYAVYLIGHEYRSFVKQKYLQKSCSWTEKEKKNESNVGSNEGKPDIKLGHYLPLICIDVEDQADDFEADEENVFYDEEFCMDIEQLNDVVKNIITSDEQVIVVTETPKDRARRYIIDVKHLLSQTSREQFESELAVVQDTWDGNFLTYFRSYIYPDIHQLDGVCMGAPLAPFMAKIFLQEYEEKFSKNFKDVGIQYFVR